MHALRLTTRKWPPPINQGEESFRIRRSKRECVGEGSTAARSVSSSSCNILKPQLAFPTVLCITAYALTCYDAPPRILYCVGEPNPLGFVPPPVIPSSIELHVRNKLDRRKLQKLVISCNLIVETIPPTSPFFLKSYCDPCLLL